MHYPRDAPLKTVDVVLLDQIATFGCATPAADDSVTRVNLDLGDRRVLLKSWLATLHGSELTVRPRLTGPLPGWGPLVRTALAWHVAYALVSFAGALAVARHAGMSGVAQSVQQGGTPAVIGLAVVLWWGGVALSSLLWWVGVRHARQLSSGRSTSR